jgi:hypothetical protein
LDDTEINTYHASIQDDVLAPPRSKIIKENFLKRILKPARRKKTVSTLLIGCFPFPSQQSLILESMQNQYLIHARRTSSGRRWEDRLNESEETKVLPDFYPPKTVYEIGNVSLLTFLNPL